MATAWFVLAVGSARDTGGNDGYDDDPSRHYDWDSTVPQRENVKPGDIIAPWDKQKLLGVSVIEWIQTGSDVKPTYVHEPCGKGRLKPLKDSELAWWCRTCRVHFPERLKVDTPVTTYRSHHSRAWQDLEGVLSGAQVRLLCDKPQAQHAMRPARWEKVRDALRQAGADLPAVATDGARALIRGGRRPATVQVRQGQGAFRQRLLDEQGETCAFSGPTPSAALEAAHLYSYADSGEHHEYGGLLLRRDLHRLFDLGHIAVEPGTGNLDVSKDIRDFPLYGQLHGRPLALELRCEHRVWLGAHWDKHRSQP